MSYGSILHIVPTNLLLLAAKQESYKKAYLLTKNIEEFSGKSSEEWTSRQKKDKTERKTGLGRRTREVIAKLNQMTALRFQTGGDIRNPRPPFGGSWNDGVRSGKSFMRCPKDFRRNEGMRRRRGPGEERNCREGM